MLAGAGAAVVTAARGSNRLAKDLVRRIRLGQTERGSFVVVLLSPVVSVPVQTSFEGSPDHGVPFERRLTLRVVEALKAVPERHRGGRGGG